MNEEQGATPLENVDAERAKEQDTQKKRRWRPKPIYIIAAIAVLLGGAWLVYHLITAGKQSTDDAQVQADVVPISPRVSGQIVQVFVVENQQVKAGQPILQIDNTDYQSRLREAQGNYDSAVAQANAADAQVQVAQAAAQGGYSSAEAQVVGSTASVSGSEADVAAARAAIIRAQADVRKAQLDLERAQMLYRQKAIPRQQLDNAQATYDASKAVVAQSKAQLIAAEDARRVAQQRVREAQGKLGVTKPVQAQIDAAVAQAKLAHAKVESEAGKLELAKLQLAYTTVKAPQDGQVSNLGVHAGQWVQPGQALVMLVPNQMYVVANFKETQITNMRVGQRAVISVDAFPAHDIEGYVESFSGGTGARFSLLPPDNATGNFVKIVQRIPVRIAWKRTPPNMPTLVAGLSVEVKVYEHEQSKDYTPPPQQQSQPQEGGAAVGRRP